jgi:hypothetical protein
VPEDHVAGKPLRLAWLLVCDLPQQASRNLRVPDTPVDCNTAIQYAVPVVTLAVTATEFHAPADGLVMVPCVNKAPGELLPVLAYNPTVTRAAVLLPSR